MNTYKKEQTWTTMEIASAYKLCSGSSNSSKSRVSSARGNRHEYNTISSPSSQAFTDNITNFQVWNLYVTFILKLHVEVYNMIMVQIVYYSYINIFRSSSIMWHTIHENGKYEIQLVVYDTSSILDYFNMNILSPRNYDEYLQAIGSIVNENALTQPCWTTNAYSWLGVISLYHCGKWSKLGLWTT